MTRLKNAKAFTLIELIVVIVIIGILAAIAAVAYNQFIANANSASAETTAQQIADGAQASATLANVATNVGNVDIAAKTITYTGVSGGKDTVFQMPTDSSVTITAPNADGPITSMVVLVESGGECANVTFSGATSVGSKPVAATVTCPTP